MEVRIASDDDQEKWNRFIDREGGSFFQYYDWKFIYEYKKQHRFIPLLIQDNNSDITGIFPLVEQKGYRIYPWLSSLPEGAAGGYLLSQSLTEDEKNLNIRIFFEFIDSNYSRTHALLRLKEQILFKKEPEEPSRILLENGYKWLDTTTTKLPCTHYLNLEMPFEEKIWNGLWSKRLRKRIRHAQKIGIHVIIDDELMYLDDYADMYCDSVKKFGVVAEKDEIYQIFKVFKDKIKLFIGLHYSQPISAALCFYTPTTVYLSKAPYLPASGEYLTNTLPICSSIQDACNSSYKYYEMGITTTADLAFHKEKFEATRIPMREYTKKFSQFKAITNKTYGYILWSRRKLVGF